MRKNNIDLWYTHTHTHPYVHGDIHPHTRKQISLHLHMCVHVYTIGSGSLETPDSSGGFERRLTHSVEPQRGSSQGRPAYSRACLFLWNQEGSSALRTQRDES